MIEHRTKKKVEMDTKSCRELLRNPLRFMEHGNVTFIDHEKDDQYRITFTWKKFGISRENSFLFTVSENEDAIIYQSDRSSPGYFMMNFAIYNDKGSNSLISLTARMDTAYLMGDKIVRDEFVETVDEILNEGIKKIEDFDFTTLGKNGRK